MFTRLATLAVACTLFASCQSDNVHKAMETKAPATTAETKAPTNASEQKMNPSDHKEESNDKMSNETADSTKGKEMTAAKKSLQRGLEYEILSNPKENGQKAEQGNLVSVHYTGWLQDEKGEKGREFDSSHKRNQALTFNVGKGRVIQGWDAMLLDMKEGEKRLVTIAPELAYGTHGAGGVIPPNATLIFEMELCSVKKA